MTSMENTEEIINETVKQSPLLIKVTNKKKQSDRIAALYQQLGRTYEKKSKKMLSCASTLTFENMPEGLKLVDGVFCGLRLCPMCSWRNARRKALLLFKVLKTKRHKDKSFIFLTLTVKSCSGDNLKATIDQLLSGWRALTLTKKHPLRLRFSGMLRNLKITYSKKEKLYNPYINVLCECSENYFTKTNNLYLEIENLVQLWRSALSVDYNPICSIDTKNKKGQVIDLTKNNVKTTDIYSSEVLHIIDTALYDRQLEIYHDSLNITKILLMRGCSIE